MLLSYYWWIDPGLRKRKEVDSAPVRASVDRDATARDARANDVDRLARVSNPFAHRERRIGIHGAPRRGASTARGDRWNS